jgi:hypothetical protein
MIFKVFSKYFGVFCNDKCKPEYWKWYKEFSEYLDMLKPYLIEKDDYYYIEIIYITELNQLIDTLKNIDKRLVDRSSFISPTNVEVDIKNKEIKLIDFIQPWQ